MSSNRLNNEGLELTDLINDVKLIELPKRLDAGDIINLSQLNHAFLSLYGVFRPNALLLLKRAVEHVVDGEDESALAIFRAHPGLLPLKVKVIDFARRHFCASGFELAGWLRNFTLCKEMVACLPDSDSGIATTEKLLMQYGAMQKNGIKYTLNDVEYTSSHYDFDPLIDAIQTLITDFNSKSDSRNKNLLTIGGLQRRTIPLVIATYTQDRHFDPFEARGYERWFSIRNKSSLPTVANGLGENFCIMTGTWVKARSWNVYDLASQSETYWQLDNFARDMNKIIKLKNESTAQFHSLRGLMEEKIVLHQQRALSGICLNW